jgi:hypothetical protein
MRSEEKGWAKEEKMNSSCGGCLGRRITRYWLKPCGHMQTGFLMWWIG